MTKIQLEINRAIVTLYVTSMHISRLNDKISYVNYNLAPLIYNVISMYIYVHQMQLQLSHDIQSINV